MSHPLIVEAAETLFVPVLIHNNKKGIDETILKKYSEPSWNNPVFRFVDGNEKDIVARRDRIWTTSGVARRMLEAVSTGNLKKTWPDQTPEYLRFVAAEENGHNATATFAMHCFWQGEVDLGALAGVKSTMAGWLQNKEVVEVVYDPDFVSYEKLVQTAQKLKCASTVFARTKEQLNIAKAIVGDAAILTREKTRRAKESDQHYYLKKTAMNYLPLTKMQATKINSALFRRVKYDSFLSPRQTKLAKQIVAGSKAAAVAAKLKSLNPARGTDDLHKYQQKLERLLESK